LVPEPIIKKIKVPWWKRVLVFALGVIQIVVGALIVAQTAGACLGLGLTMIKQGCMDIYTSIFNPEAIQDLGQYFGAKAV
jgi:hypothetical protein